LPVRELGKGANERCRHQRHGCGCAVYDKTESIEVAMNPGGGLDLASFMPNGKMPTACKLWTCRWLTGEDTADLSRPDRSRVVIDEMPDYIEADGVRIGAIQIWVDPDHPDAWKAPEIKAFIERRAEGGQVAIIRYSSHEGFIVFAPYWMADGQWHEEHASPIELTERETTRIAIEIEEQRLREERHAQTP
jgi:hypothetical protein